MTIRKRLQNRTVSDEYHPRLTITIDGAHDVYRFARFLEMAGVKNGAWVGYHRLGLRVLASMDRQRPGLVADFARDVGPARVIYRGRRRPAPVQLHIGMTEDELQQAAEAVR